MNRHFLLLLSFLIIALTCSEEPVESAFTYSHSTDSLFGSLQNINLIEISNNTKDEYELAFGENQPRLIPTSILADSLGAVVAINAGFFDMRAGGSVTYFEIADSTLSPTRPSGIKYSMNDSLRTGAVVILNDQTVLIEPEKKDSVYEKSTDEAYVLVTGPLLLQDGEKVKLASMNFVNDRHPRTVICTKTESILLATIDGRSETSSGMNLHELQDFLISQNCMDAVNLDGGGSTTMWIKGRGVVNEPSDKSGERPVANILIVKKRDL
ncbi:MAG TPA: hypothetical protein DEQ34_07215 [Balneolaceae bacterium]|nr:hypothetical protein [Balneolaceae bacterium]|tara:strand:- start:125183 stop:125986 length:804 start_codon:yes stop_codon:yes gene_type:complete